MALTPTVATGQIITPTWGNEIRDRTIQVFANFAALKSGWTTPPDGAPAITVDDHRVWIRNSGASRWETRTSAQIAKTGTDASGTFVIAPADVGLDGIIHGNAWVHFAADSRTIGWSTARPGGTNGLQVRVFVLSTNGSAATVSHAVNASLAMTVTVDAYGWRL